MKDITFWEWLKLRHPEVHLTPMQKRWADLVVRQLPVLYQGARATGRTFLLRLIAEYFKEIAE